MQMRRRHLILNLTLCLFVIVALAGCGDVQPDASAPAGSPTATSAPTDSPTATSAEPDEPAPVPEQAGINLFASEPTKSVHEIDGGWAGIELRDMNADGFVDLVAADTFENVVSIYPNNGQGEFQMAEVLPAGAGSLNVAAADFDGDGDLDLAVTNPNDDSVGMLMNDGAGQFADMIDVPVGADPYFLRVVDVELDGDPDLVVNYDFTSDVDVLRNDGAGGFAADDPIVLTTGGSMVTEIGDVNNDSFPDLVVVHPLGATISLLLNDGAGAFGPAVEYAVGTTPKGVAIGDLNGDGAPDLAVPTGTGTISILKNDGTGAFNAGETYEPGGNLLSVVLADMTGDGLPDLLVADEGSFNVRTFVNQGDGVFAPHADYPTFPVGPRHVYVVDINADGIDELVAAGESRVVVFDFAD